MRQIPPISHSHDMKTFHLCLFTASLTLACFAHAKPMPGEFWDTNYLKNAARPPKSVILDPAAFQMLPPGDDAGEVGIVRKSVALRSEESDALTIAEADSSPEWIFKACGINTDKFPLTVDFLKFMRDEAAPVIARQQILHARSRPIFVFRDLPALTPTPQWPGYPCEQSAIVFVYAEILARCSPQHAAEARNYAFAVAMRRLVSGQNWPSDLSAGRALSEAILSQLQDSPIFSRMLDALITAEW